MLDIPTSAYNTRAVLKDEGVRKKGRDMRRFALLIVFIAFPLAIAATTATASGTTYSFNLVGPNFAENPATGDTIRTTGSGSFNPDAGTVSASGSFTHLLADGSVFAKGTWVATGFDSFTSFGGPTNGQQGGVLQITVTLFPNGGAPHTGVSMSITCVINAPPGYEEGTTVDGFTDKTGGTTLIHAGS